MLTDELLGDILSTDAARHQFLQFVLGKRQLQIVHLCHYLAHGIGDLPTAGVAHSHDDGHAVIIFRQILHVADLLLDTVRQPFPVANHPEPDVVVGKEIHLDKAEHQSHQRFYLIGRAIPVLRRESVKRQVFHTQTGTL